MCLIVKLNLTDDMNSLVEVLSCMNTSMCTMVTLMTIFGIFAAWLYTRYFTDEISHTCHRHLDSRTTDLERNRKTNFAQIAGKKESPPKGGGDTSFSNEVEDLKSKYNLRCPEPKLSEEEQIKEYIVQREQLSGIFKLMKENEEKYGMTSMKDMEEQLKLYYS